MPLFMLKRYNDIQSTSEQLQIRLKLVVEMA